MYSRNTGQLASSTDHNTLMRLSAGLDQYATRQRGRASVAAQQLARWVRELAWEDAPAEQTISTILDHLSTQVNTLLQQAVASARDGDLLGVAIAAGDIQAFAFVADLVRRGPDALAPGGQTRWSGTLPPIGIVPVGYATGHSTGRLDSPPTTAAMGARQQAPRWPHAARLTAPLPPLPPVSHPYPTPWTATAPDDTPTQPEFFSRFDH